MAREATDGLENSPELLERRILEGPNAYFDSAAVKLALRPCPGCDPGRANALADQVQSALRSHRIDCRIRLIVRRPERWLLAFDWQRRGVAEALATELPTLLMAGGQPDIEAAVRRIAAADPGEPPSAVDPAIPVVAVSGTNGKTTTVRLVAHLAHVAGRRAAYTTTDGVFAGGRLVLEGDYTGFQGATTALAQPDIDLAVLEVARGGILLKGMGVVADDVGVVTNVSDDHLGQYDVDTLEELVHVKGVITRITRPEGWDVLNADDPLVAGLETSITGRPWLFARSGDNPRLSAATQRGGRATYVADGAIQVADRGSARRLLDLRDLPVTFYGLSTQHTENVLAATSASLAVGLPEEAVVAGLRTFAMDAQHNPVRANVFELDSRLVILDYAHNTAGVSGLGHLSRALAAGHRVLIGIGTAGDRPDASLRSVGRAAAETTDLVVIAEKLGYLRGRSREDLARLFREGVQSVRPGEVPVLPDEVAAFEWMLSNSSPGDVVALGVHVQRAELLARIEKLGGHPIDQQRLRALAVAARPVP